MAEQIPYRTLGKTGEKVSILGLGGAHLRGIKNHSEAIGLIKEAIDRGITFMDNSWDYGEGESEERMGEALKGGYRDRVFLMTKIDGRTKKAARSQLDESLKRLRVEYVDLIQLHEVIRWSDPEISFAPSGAMDALVEARDAGKVRYIGFTGHKDPGMHLKMLEQDFDWDTVQMPLNVLDAHYNSFEKNVLPVLISRDIGVLAMKPFSAGLVFPTNAVSAIEALHYVMSLPVSVVITGIDSRDVLNQNIEAATTYHKLDTAEISDILSRTYQVAQTGEFELYKTTHHYDATINHPEWLASA